MVQHYSHRLDTRSFCLQFHNITDCSWVADKRLFIRSNKIEDLCLYEVKSSSSKEFTNWQREPLN